jgi:cell division septation protein DedD
MEHQFTFNNKRLFLLIFAIVAAAVLTFFCGVITGMNWKPGAQQPATSVSRGAVPTVNPLAMTALSVAGVKPPVIPVVPGVTAPVVIPAAAPLPVAPVIPTAPALVTQGTSLAIQALATKPAAQPGAAPTPAAAAAPAVPPPASAGAAPAGASAAPADPNPADQPYVLQFGAFREQKQAKQLQDDLTKKGLATVILNMVDEDLRTWHMVRFGGFKDIDSASKAASDASKKADLQAFVRRSDSL